MSFSYAVNDPTAAGSSPQRKGFRPIFLLFAMPVVAIALVALFLPRDVSHAASRQYGVQYEPGANNVSMVLEEGCFADAGGTVDADEYTGTKESANERAAIVKDVLSQLPALNIGGQYGSVNVSTTEAKDDKFDLAVRMKIDCDFLESPVADPGPSLTANAVSDGMVMGPKVRAAALPNWGKGAASGVAGAAVYAAMVVAVTAGVVGLAGDPAAGVIDLEVLKGTVALLSGCVSGSTSTAVTRFIEGALPDWQQNLAKAVTNCISAVAGALPVVQVGKYVGSAIKGLFTSPDNAIAEIGGTELAALISQGTGLAPLVLAIPEAFNAAAEGARAAM